MAQLVAIAKTRTRGGCSVRFGRGLWCVGWGQGVGFFFHSAGVALALLGSLLGILGKLLGSAVCLLHVGRVGCGKLANFKSDGVECHSKRAGKSIHKQATQFFRGKGNVLAVVVDGKVQHKAVLFVGGKLVLFQLDALHKVGALGNCFAHNTVVCGGGAVATACHKNFFE